MRSLFVPFLAIALTTTVPAFSQDSDRSVHIIEDSPAVHPTVPQTPTKPPTGVTPALPVVPETEARADNPAGLRLELLPSAHVSIGSMLTFQVTTQQPGYLILVDVDSRGKLTQIYPNSLSLKAVQDEQNNFLKGGVMRTIPDPHAGASFQFVISPPLGIGMVVAILSDKPVQMIDLPDVPATIAGQRAALNYVRDTTRTLKILPSDDTGSIQESKWSFAPQFYAID
jgi:Domain of unknown function (DUF4384)